MAGFFCILRRQINLMKNVFFTFICIFLSKKWRWGVKKIYTNWKQFSKYVIHMYEKYWIWLSVYVIFNMLSLAFEVSFSLLFITKTFVITTKEDRKYFFSSKRICFYNQVFFINKYFTVHGKNFNKKGMKKNVFKSIYIKWN